ncbi:MAG: efflux transporter outer membrane subunit [Sphingobium sp.]|nr:efflux transporter outer membrane subunit [Sphingobium sp.]
MHIAFRFLPLSSMMVLAACTLGPDYQGPASAGAPVPGQNFVRADGETRTTAPAVAQWWTTLGDPILNELQSRALAGNPSLAATQARMQQARAALRQEKRNSLPSIGASGTYAHAQLPGIDLSEITNGETEGKIDEMNLFNLGLDASWEIDLFGGQRRTVEASRAQLDAAIATIADAQVSLTADVAQSYVTLRDVQQRLSLARQIIDDQQAIMKLVEQRFAQGAASASMVEMQRQLLEQKKAAIHPLQAEQDAQRNALAVLTGQAPGALDDMLGTGGAIPLPPANVDIGDPAALIQRRPDIRAAERKYAAATAKIGVAEAARFPRLSFMGIIGMGGSQIDNVIDPDNLSAIALPRLTWNFLDFGRSAARVRQAEGARDEAAAQYNQAVLGALRDTEDSLTRYGAYRQALINVARTEASAERTVAIAQQRFNAGTVNRITFLEQERDLRTARQSLSEATARMTAGYIALQKALGLGWQ